MAVELLNAYISVSIETDQIPKQIKSALGDADVEAGRAGKSMGGKMSAALGKALKVGGAAAAAGGVATIGTAMVKGFQRLTAIDDAKGKLTGLGHTAQAQTKIMDSALASVKGTAFGLGDAATLAASAVATGIKPGEALTKHLTMIGDAASIAGVGLNEMGSIFTKIQNSGRAYMGDLNQLADRGIPIYEWLGQAAGKSGDEIMKMASKGQVSAQMVYDAINTNIGGAAQAAGKTVRGAFENMVAALGRLGAAAQAPFFARLPGAFTSATGAIDALTPKIESLAVSLDKKIFDEWGPKIREALESARDSGALDGLMDTIRGLVATAKDLGPTLGTIFTELGRASAALGVGTWQLFLTALQAVGGALNVASPALKVLSGLMERHPALVAAAVAAWTAFKTLPGIMRPVGASLQSLGEKVKGFTSSGKGATKVSESLAAAQETLGKAQATAAVSSAKAMVAEEGLQKVKAKAAASSAAISAAESRLATLRASGSATTKQIVAAEAQLARARQNAVGSGSVALAEAQLTQARRASVKDTAAVVAAQNAVNVSSKQMGTTVQGAYAQGAAGAARFTRTAGLAAVGMKGVRSAVTGLLNMFGGPWMAGLAAAGGVLMMVMSDIQKGKQHTEAYRAALDRLRETQLATNSAMMASRGALTEEVYSALTSQAEAFIDVADKEIAAHKGLEMARTASGFSASMSARMIPEMSDALSGLSITAEDVGKAVGGTRVAWDHFVGRLAAAGVPDEALSGLRNMRTDFERTQNIARSVSPGLTAVGDAMRVLGDKASSAADKSKALKDALDALNPAATKAEAVAKHSATLDKIAESTKEAIDETKGFGAALLDNDTIINTRVENGRSLFESLKQIREASMDAAAAGKYDAAAKQQTEAQIRALGEQYKMSASDIMKAANDLGQSDVELLMTLSGKDEVTRGIGEVALAWSKKPDEKTFKITEDKANPQVLERLKKMGIEASKPVEGVVTLTPKTEEARKKLLEFNKQFQGINNQTATPTLKLNDLMFKSKDSEARKALLDLQSQHVSPEADLAIQALLDGKNLSMQQIADLDAARANPKVDMETSAVIEKITQINTLLDQAAQTRTATINATYTGTAIGLMAGSTPERADGAIVPANADSFANGGLKAIKKPMRAGIFQGRGAGTIFAEKETGGEAYVPLAESKRTHSTAILATVAEMFGLSLVPKDSISGTLGAIAGGAVSKLLQKAGVDGITRFADGGFNATQLRELVDGGHGASQPLTGAPYVWGGVNWGDCSGAVSAPARAAAGLDPFGGRMSTGSMGGDLPAMGFQQGDWRQGYMGVGFYNGGPGGGHAAGTLPDGTNVEMGGQNGGGMVGGSAAGANDPQFTDRWILPVGPSWQDPGADPGGMVLRPDGTYGPMATDPRTGNSGDSSSGGNTISGRFGAAAGAFVEGQLSDIFKTLYINDSPGVLGALAEYENSQQRSGVAPDDTAGSKQQFDQAKLKSKQDYEDEKLRRKQEHDAELQGLKDDLAAKRIDQAEYDRKSRELKKTFDENELAKKQEYDRAQLSARQQFDDLQRQQRALPSSPGGVPSPPSDPGTSLPSRGEDLGSASAVDDGTPQSAVKRAFQPAQWDVGQFWTDTDWIVGKESSWNPTAQNPNSTAYGLFQFLDETWGTVGATKTDDPYKQGVAGLKYIQQRYGDPSKARTFWEANGWYDKGGIADGLGFMAKATLKPERVLDPRQTVAFEKLADADFLEDAMAGGGYTVHNTYNITGADANEVARKIAGIQNRDRRRFSGRPM